MPAPQRFPQTGKIVLKLKDGSKKVSKTFSNVRNDATVTDDKIFNTMKALGGLYIKPVEEYILVEQSELVSF